MLFEGTTPFLSENITSIFRFTEAALVHFQPLHYRFQGNDRIFSDDVILLTAFVTNIFLKGQKRKRTNLGCEFIIPTYQLKYTTVTAGKPVKRYKSSIFIILYVNQLLSELNLKTLQ